MSKLSVPRPRADLIAAYAYGTSATGGHAYGSTVQPAPPKTSAPDGSADPAAADTAVSDAIAELKAAITKAQAAQKADPDTADPKDEKVTADLDAVAQAIDALEADQKTDAAANPDAPAAKPEPVAAAAPPPAKAKAPKTSPVDDHGNVDPSAVCANPDCGHLASSHLNDDAAGENTGACQMTNCECLSMAVETQPNSGGDDQPAQDGQSTPPGEPSEELGLAPTVVVPELPGGPVPPGPPKTDGAQLNAPPQLPGSDNMGPAFTIPVVIIEGQPTGDGRQIAPGALTWRIPPLPLMGLATETHDPEGFDQNDPAVICGRIDGFSRQPGEGDTQIISAFGFYLADEHGLYFSALTEAMGRCGISADINPQETEITSEGVDDDGWPVDLLMNIVAGEILGATQVPFPAFEGAYIVLGDGSEKPDAQPIPQRSDVPDQPPAIVAAGGQLIHLISREACERCDQGVQVITAAGAGPVAPPAAWFEDPHFTQGDGRLVEILDRRGQRAVGGKYACPLTITDEGRVYGHLAPWDVCHIGKPGCVTAPPSKSDYAYFKRGQHVVTAEGQKIRVGALTVDAGHANLTADPGSAMAHYDNIATGAADVNAGEDEFGIWIAGAIRPTATVEQVAALRASSISGDWRGLGGSLELVAALAVPVPGFPHAVVAGASEEALTAAGASVMHRLKHPAPAAPAQKGDVALRHALAPLLSDARSHARGRLAAVRG